jgi:hypothetical protein
MGKEKRTKKPIKHVRKQRKKWLLSVICLALMGLAAAIFYGLMNRSATEPAATISQQKKRLILTGWLAIGCARTAGM